MESVLGDPGATPAALDEAQSEVDHLTAQWSRLIHELRVVQFEAPEDDEVEGAFEKLSGCRGHRYRISI